MKNYIVRLPFGTRIHCVNLATRLINCFFSFKYQDDFPQFVVSIKDINERELINICKAENASLNVEGDADFLVLNGKDIYGR
jgi:hypothetical protein